jgi:hypothetical protein
MSKQLNIKDNNFRLFPNCGHITLSQNDILKNIAKAKKYLKVADTSTADIEAGQTYMGQFIAHEIVATPQNNEVRLNISPGLNLKSLYGDEYADAYFNARGHFILGKANGSDIYGTDLLRDHNEVALIPEFRNDENIIISQFHLFWQKVHNTIIEHLREQSTIQVYDYFNFTKNVVVALFHRLVKEDFLKQICMTEIYDYYFQNGSVNATSYIFANQPLKKIPIEFSRAAFRFAHSMVREHYFFSNNVGGGANTEEIFKFRNSSLPSDFIIDWNFFFQTDRFYYKYFNCANSDKFKEKERYSLIDFFNSLIDGKQKYTSEEIEHTFKSREVNRDFQSAKAIDTKIVNAMTRIPIFENNNKENTTKLENKKIDIRDVDLAIAYKSEMATGVYILDQIQNFIDIEKILEYDYIFKINSLLLESFVDLDHIPLFLYVLKEAELTASSRNFSQCRNLGCVGSFIVMETLLESMALGSSTLIDFDESQIDSFIESNIFVGQSTRFGHVINYLKKRGMI